MHEFERYRAPSGEHIVDLVRQNPFALLVSSVPGAAPVATHTPIIVDPSDPPASGTFVGSHLLGHIARVNPQWESLDADVPVLLVFSGPHGYVSPTAYGYNPSVPTWDYAAVHLTARVEVLDGRDDCMRIVKETVTALEGLEPVQWDMTASIERFESIVQYVVGFRFEIIDEKAVFKASQDMPRDVRERVAAASRARGNPHGDVAALIEDIGKDRE